MFHARGAARVRAVVLGTALLAALIGCSKDDDEAPPGSSVFRGTLTGTNTTGCFSFTVSTSAPAPQVGNRARATVDAWGEVRLNSGSTTVYGTYDESADVINLSGEGWTFAGSGTGTGIRGTFTGPVPRGSGVFSVRQEGAGSDSIVVFTGSYTGGSSGRFDFSIRGTSVFGSMVDSAGGVTVLEGTFSPGDSSITIVNPANPSGPPLATGTWHPDNSVSGSYDDGAGDSGTWDGTKFN